MPDRIPQHDTVLSVLSAPAVPVVLSVPAVLCVPDAAAAPDALSAPTDDSHPTPRSITGVRHGPSPGGHRPPARPTVAR